MPCHTRGKYGHWKTANRTDGSLHEDVKAYTTSAELTSPLNQSVMNKLTNGNKDSLESCKTASFNIGCVSGDMKRNEGDFWTLVYDGTAYSAISIVELKLYDDLLVDSCIGLNPTPASLDSVAHWQCGTRQHASASRKFHGSLSLSQFRD